MTQADILIISDEPEFVSALVRRWSKEHPQPTLTVAAGDIWNGRGELLYDLIILGNLHAKNSHSTLRFLNDRTDPPVLYVAGEKDRPPFLKDKHSRFAVVSRRDRWTDTLMLISGEILRRTKAVQRAQRAEKSAMDSQRFATLGRYMLEMRPAINDVLTSVLGNADLLLGESQASSEARQRIQAIHGMVLRLNEVMRRFSSLATEMPASENVRPCGEAPPGSSARV